ncbi:DEAD/DEAH box helicase [Candidatus Dependentiae bacterium]|nr:DEAD/DEAH box helicase [Candidatus Dependentiae bacterium]
MKLFSDLSGLSTHVLSSLNQMKFTEPTPIQAQAIPLALEGKDILGSAQTGTGKTGAFAIPMVSKLLNNEIQGALILTPTRELAAQVMVTINSILGKNSGLNAALLIGGEDIRRQLVQLRRNPRIVVGTPGRINDHIERGTVQLSKVNFVVLDETDRMLDMGFGQQIDSIIAQVAPDRQTLMFSATMPNNIMHMASKYLKNPERIAIGSCLKPVAAIDQQSIKLGEEQKYDHLIKELTVREGSVVVFVKTKFGAKRIADRLYRDRFQAQAIHGNLRQNKRDQVIQGFKNKKFRILVATDVAARGLDVPHVAHVINHDLPQCPEDYIHRIGRTARAGATGSAVNFITPQDNRLWRAIERFMNTGEAGETRNGRSERSGGGRRFGGGRPERSHRFGKRDGFRSHRSDKFEGSSDRSERFERSDRSERPERSDRSERPERSDRSERPERSDRFERSDRSERGSSESSDGAFRRDRNDRSFSKKRSGGFSRSRFKSRSQSNNRVDRFGGIQ